MHFESRFFRMWLGLFLASFIANLGLGPRAAAQSTYTAQLSGVVKDASGGVIPGAKVILTDETTGVGMTYSTESRGIYVFTGIRPGSYAIRVEAPGMAPQERKGLTLAVSQQATLDFSLSPAKCLRA